MLTTFARIAKILKGLVEPRNWVEEAFADISGGGGGSVLPDVTSEDKDKFLHTNATTGALEWESVASGFDFALVERDESQNWTCNKTYSQIDAMATPIVSIMGIFVQLVKIYDERSGQYRFETMGGFTPLNVFGNSVIGYSVELWDDNTLYVNTITYPQS